MAKKTKDWKEKVLNRKRDHASRGRRRRLARIKG